MVTELMHVCPGETKQMPLAKDKRYLLRCHSGMGQLDMAEKPKQKTLIPGDEVKVKGRQVDSISGLNTMIIVITKID